MPTDTQQPTSTPSSRLIIEGREAFHEAACKLAQSARLHLAILSNVLEREIYGESDFIQAVQHLATRHRYAKVRILVHTPEWASRSGHRLIELARRLDSFIEIRQLAEQDKEVLNEVLIADEEQLLLRESPTHLSAQYFPASPGEARAWRHRYDRLWAVAEQVPGFRRLGL